VTEVDQIKILDAVDNTATKLPLISPGVLSRHTR